MKPYASIKNYLERFSIIDLGKFKIRWHKILSADGTPYLHSHPFCFISIILKGSYVEQLLIDEKLIEKKHTFGSIIFRKSDQFHRIKSANDCRTLFFAFYNKQCWNLKNHHCINNENFKTPSVNGIYIRIINQEKRFCKFDKYWFIGSDDIDKAIKETRLSIYQVENWNELIITI